MRQWARARLPKFRTGAIWTGVALCYAALLLAVYHRVWWDTGAQRRFFGWDCIRVYWQDLVFAIDALSRGELPLWNPFMAMGYSFASEPQTGLYSPMNWLLYGMGLATGSRGPWLIQAKVLLTFWLGLLGTHLWVVRRHGSHGAAALAAITFALGSPLLVFKNSSLAWPILYLPWALLALEGFLARPSLRRGALLGGAVWLAGSAGSPQGFFFCGLALAAYWLALTLGSLRAPAGEDAATPHAPGFASGRVSGAVAWLLRARFALRRLGGSLRRQAAGLAVAAVLAALLLAPVYVPAWLAMGETPRASRSLSFLLAQPHTPAALEELLLSQRDRNWFLDLYSGALAVVLAGFALFTVSRRNAPRRLFWLGLLGGALLLSLGQHTPVLPWLVRHVPGFDLFRIPYRYKLLAVVGLVALAAEGWTSLIRGGLSWRRGLVWILLAGGWVVYAWLAATGYLAPRSPMARAAAWQHLRTVTPALVLLTAGLFGPAAWRALQRRSASPSSGEPCAPAAEPRRRWLRVGGGRALHRCCLLGALAFGLADLWSAGSQKIQIMERPPHQENDYRLYARLAGLRSHAYRLFQYPSHLSAANARVRELGGYTTFPMRLGRFDDVYRVARYDRAFLRHFNVRWIHARIARHQVRSLGRYAWRRGPDLLELRRPAPLLALYPGYGVLPRGRAIARLRRLGNKGILGCALLESEEARRLPPAARTLRGRCRESGTRTGSRPPAAGRLLRYGRNRLLFDVRSVSGGVAVVNEPMFPGWRAWLDGEPVPLVRANHLLRALYVPPGAHRIELRYWPPGYTWLLAGFGLGLMGLLVLLWGVPPWAAGGVRRG